MKDGYTFSHNDDIILPTTLWAELMISKILSNLVRAAGKVSGPLTDMKNVLWFENMFGAQLFTQTGNLSLPMQQAFLLFYFYNKNIKLG